MIYAMMLDYGRLRLPSFEEGMVSHSLVWRDLDIWLFTIPESIWKLLRMSVGSVNSQYRMPSSRLNTACHSIHYGLEVFRGHNALQTHGRVGTYPEFHCHGTLQCCLLTFASSIYLTGHPRGGSRASVYLQKAPFHARNHILPGIHLLRIVECRFRDTQLPQPLFDCDTMLLAIAHNLFDLFACHHNFYNCNG